MRSKGISLPIEMVIIIAISVIVLLALVAYFVLGIGQQQQYMQDATAWNKGCAMIKARGCSSVSGDDIQTMTITMYKPYQNVDREGTIWDACKLHLGYTDASTDAARCVAACCNEGGSRTSDTTTPTTV
jgi:hypothetical protein